MPNKKAASAKTTKTKPNGKFQPPSHFTLGLIAVFVLVLLVLGTLFVGIPIHALGTRDFKASIAKVAIDSKTPDNIVNRFGHLWGNSNHCDSQVLAMYYSNLSSRDFAAQLSQTSFASVMYPFNKVTRLPQLYKVDISDLKLYYVDGTTDFKVIKSTTGSGYTTAPGISFDYSVDGDERNFIVKSATDYYRETKRNYNAPKHNDGKFLYILSFTDQSFDVLDVNTDFRCN